MAKILSRQEDGCVGSTLHKSVWTVHSGRNRHYHWVTRTWTPPPPLAFPRGYQQIHPTHDARSTLFFPVAHHTVVPSPYSLWNYQTCQGMRIGIQDCAYNRLIEVMQTPLRYTFILCYRRPWSHHSGSLTQLVQMPERLSTRLLWCQNRCNTGNLHCEGSRSGSLLDCQWG